MLHCFWSLECILLFWFTSWDDIWWHSSPVILNMLFHTMTGPGTKAKRPNFCYWSMSAHLLAMATLWHLLWVLKQRSPMIGVSEPIQNSFILVLAPSKFPTRISWTVLLWLAHLASPLSGLCRQAHVFRGVHYHWVLALSWNWIVSTEIFSSNLATSVDSFGILDTLYMDRFWMTSKRSIWSMLATVHLQNLISPRWQHQGKTMQSQPKQSVTQGHFTQTSFPLCGKHCWTPLSVFFTLSPEGQRSIGHTLTGSRQIRFHLSKQHHIFCRKASECIPSGLFLPPPKPLK